MAQLYTYVSKSLAARAKARGVAVSRYLADLIRRDAELGWPDGFFDRVAGGWKGVPLRRAPQGRHAPAGFDAELPAKWKARIRSHHEG